MEHQKKEETRGEIEKKGAEPLERTGKHLEEVGNTTGKGENGG